MRSSPAFYSRLIVYFIFTFLPFFGMAGENCRWCLNAGDLEKLKSLGQLGGPSLLKEVRKDGVQVLVLDSQRKISPKGFAWQKVEKSSGLLSQVTQIEGLLGKTLCQGEHKMSESGDTIAIASDALRTTLIHEYMHILQIRKDRSWCELSKTLWQRPANEQEKRQQMDREWDVVKAMWNHLKAIQPTIEDEISISHEVFQNAQNRAGFDPNAIDFLKRNKVVSFFHDKIQEYKTGVKTEKPAEPDRRLENEIKKTVARVAFSTGEHFKNATYCYFIFQKVLDNKVVTPDLFVQYVKGAGLSLEQIDNYKRWLNTPNGVSCKAEVGEGFENLEIGENGKEYAIFLNLEAIRNDGSDLSVVEGHELLHVAFAKYKKKHPEIAKTWKNRPEKLKVAFKEKHVGYDFANEAILLREFFSYTFEKNLETGLKLLME